MTLGPRRGREKPENTAPARCRGVTDPIQLDAGGGFLSIWSELEVHPELVLAEPSADTRMPAEEEAMLF